MKDEIRTKSNPGRTRYDNHCCSANNQAWAQKLADQGYTVVDIGNPTQGLSPFYEMEKAILFPAK